MNKFEQPKRSHSFFSLSPIAVFILILLSGHSEHASGQTQQWSTAGNGTDIYNINSGKVGIGTSTPGAQLEINKSQNASTALVLDNSYTTIGNQAFSGFWFKQGGANRFFLGSINDGNNVQNGGPGAVQFWNFANGPMLFSTNNTERVRIDGAGNVSIGTTVPLGKLSVAGSIGTSGNIYQYAGATRADWGMYSDGNPYIYSTFSFGKQTTTSNAPSDIVTWNLQYSLAASGVGADRNFGLVGWRKDGGYTVPMYFQENGNVIFNRYGTVNGNVGIGTTAPTAKFEVSGTPATSTNLVKFSGADSNGNLFNEIATTGLGGALLKLTGGGGTSFAIQSTGVYSGAGNNKLVIGTMSNVVLTLNSDGNTGIGTTTPAYKLDVAGQIRSSTGGFIFPDGTIQTTAATGTNSGGSQWSAPSSNTVYTTGNVGIGSPSPNEKLVILGSNIRPIIGDSATHTALYSTYNTQNFNSLEIYSNGGLSSALVLTNNVASGAAGQITFANKAAGVEGTNDLRLGTIASFTDGAANSGYLNFFTANAGTLTEKMRIDKAGNVGVGTTTPAYRLDIQGGQVNASGGLCIAGDCRTAWSTTGGSQWSNSGSNISFSTGNVGVGIIPGYKLDVQSSSNIIARFGSTAAAHNQVIFDAPSGYNSNLTLQQGGIPKWFLGNRAANNRFSLIESTGSAEVFTILQNGYVGIGTVAPTTALDVHGDINVTGNINAKYQDVAEWVPATRALPAGTVVVLNPTQSNQVMASEKPYDTRVAGVISERPGIALGEAGADKVLVATTGRVKVRVDASRGAIQVGDLLVTSEREGVAMKSEPLMIQGRPFHSPGTLLGKALEPLKSGVGEILVLLSLQ
jgi:hypothetical protein